MRISLLSALAGVLHPLGARPSLGHLPGDPRLPGVAGLTTPLLPVVLTACIRRDPSPSVCWSYKPAST
jgi:hypothetical protein